MMKTIIAVAVALAAVTSTSMSAQTSPGDTLQSASTTLHGEWTLQQCIDYALANNIQIRQGFLSIKQNDVTVMARRGELLPSLSFSTGHNVSWRPWSEQYVDIQNGTMSTTNSVVNYNGTYGIQSQWTVWDGGRNRKNVELSEKNRELSVLNTATTAAGIQEQIAQLYVQILYQAEGVEVYKAIAESSEVQAERARKMYEVGSMSRADCAQVEAQLSQDRFNVANSITQLDQYKLQLKQLLEIVSAEEMNVADPHLSDDNVLSLVPDKADVYRSALQSRPEILYAKGNIEAADINISIARRGYYPTIGMSGGINTSTASGMHKNFADQLQNNLSSMIGVTLSVPIFDNRKNKTNVLSAKLEKENAQLSLEAADRDLYSSIETFWLNARNAQQQYMAARDNVASMQESYDLVSEQFNVGLKDVVALITGKNNLLQARQQMLQSKYTALLNLSLLRYYAGNPLTLE